MDLLAITPIKTAKFKFISPADGEVVSTAKGSEMFVEIFGSHTQEFQASLLKKHQRTVSICGKHGHDNDENEMPEACKKDIEASQVEFLCDVTTGILFEIAGKESKSKKAFYGNSELSYWIGEIGKFADNTGNFINA